MPPGRAITPGHQHLRSGKREGKPERSQAGTSAPLSLSPFYLGGISVAGLGPSAGEAAQPQAQAPENWQWIVNGSFTPAVSEPPFLVCWFIL